MVTPETPQTPPTIAPAPRLLLRPADAAEVVGLSERLLWSLTKAGKIPVLRIGRATRYALKDLEEWIERQRLERDQSCGEGSATDTAHRGNP